MSSNDFVIENGVLKKYLGSDENIIIPDDVTEIGRNAFFESGIKSVFIPGNVKHIGNQAFKNCASLANVTISEGVTSVRDHAFFNCACISEIVLPDTINRIGENAFKGCSALAKIVLPDKPLIIRDDPFIGTAYYKNASHWDKGVLYIGRHLIKARATVDHLTIRPDTLSIATWAFNGCNKLTEVVIPASVAKIEESQLFPYCKNLKSIRLLGSTTILTDSALPFDDVQIFAPELPLANLGTRGKSLVVRSFIDARKEGYEVAGERCDEYIWYIRSQRKKLYPLAAADPAFLRLMLQEKIVPQNEFEDVFDLVKKQTAGKENEAELTTLLLNYKEKNLKLVDETKKLEREMDFALTGAMSAADAKLKWGFRKKEDGTICITAFKEKGSAATVPATIGKAEVTEIGENAFSTKQKRVDEILLKARKYLKTVIIPESVKRIGKGAFSGCENLLDITIPSGVTEMEENIFYKCGSLKSILIPESVTVIGAGAFCSCVSLEEIAIPEGVKMIGELAFAYTRLSIIRIPGGVQRIGKRAFDGSGLKEIIFSDGLTDIDNGAFSSCSSLKSVTIPESVTRIGDEAFSRCYGLTSIIIPKNVASIGWEAFRKCPALTIHAPAGSYAEQYAKENNIPFVAE